MIYHTNPDKLRRYDRTDYRRHPFWIQRRPVRIRRTVMAVVVPLVCGVLGYLAMAGRDAFLRMESAMAAWALPCMVLFPRCHSQLEKRPLHLPGYGNLPL